MLTLLRREVQACLCAIPCQRKPALRRTDDPDFLLMTDLPQAAVPESVAAFTAALQPRGWTVRETSGWLLLDRPLPIPAYTLPADYPGEYGCCVWLLRQHPGNAAPPEMLRALAKASEQGSAQVERLCAAWHRQFAAQLRRHQPLPGGLLPYLCALNKESET